MIDPIIYFLRSLLVILEICISYIGKRLLYYLSVLLLVSVLQFDWGCTGFNGSLAFYSFFYQCFSKLIVSSGS